MSTIATVRAALPPHRYPQAEITAMFGDVVLGTDRSRRPLLQKVHASAGVTTRHLAQPLQDYRDPQDFGRSNDLWIATGLELGGRALVDALTAAGLTPADVDCIVTVSVTGVAAPSLDARLVPLVGLRPDVKRVPVFGLGCVAGAAGVARIHDYLAGHPDDVAVLVSVELCSLTLQRDDSSTANLVASGLFGDGAAAVVMLGRRRAGPAALRMPRVLATRSRLYPDTEDVMGWQVGAGGFRIVLSADVPGVVARHLREDVDSFLYDADLKLDDVTCLVVHPGGPKVLSAVTGALDRPMDDVAVTRDLLAANGNLSSASVLHVLERTMADPPPPGAHGLMMAMGPGFCSELVLLQW